jgi:hypothetical protein
VSERAARIVLGVLVAGLLVACLRTNLARLSGGRFWGDGATYYSMAWSLAQDGDLEYEARDLYRVRREFPSGPQGVFLKRASGALVLDASAGFPWLRRLGETERRIYFAKPFVYPVVAAPFVRWLGTRGLLVTNALCLGLCLVLGYAELRRRASPGAALALSSVLFLATVTPVYLLWPAPELLNVALVAAGLHAWRRQRVVLAAALLGVATYSKPYNLWLAIPLGLGALLMGGGSWLARVLEAARRGVVLLAAALALFGANAAVTGEWNYQGGRERKTFYDRFPGDVQSVAGLPRPVTFGNSGIWMSTNELGPRVEGDEAPPQRGGEPPRAASEIRQSFFWNLGYFWVGRFGGALAYFFPAVLATALFLLRGPREAPGWLALASLAVSFLFYISMIPDNWYGGTGTLGNRYFLNLLPLALYLAPRGAERWLAAAGLAAAVVFLRGLLLEPMRHSLQPGEHAIGAPYAWLPAELTMLNDLGVFAEPWRKKQPVGDTEGDPARGRRADPAAYYLYFADDGTWGREERAEGVGFRVRPGARAEVFLRALEPVRRMAFHATGGPEGGELTVTTAGRTLSLAPATAETREGALEPGDPFVYKDSFVYVLKLRSDPAGPVHAGPSDGVFVRIRLEVVPRPVPPAR